MTAEIKCTLDIPEHNTEEAHIARLKELDLRWGYMHVFRDNKSRFWVPIESQKPYPSYTKKDIDHNVKRIVDIMKAEGLTFMGKAYNSDLFKSRQRITDKTLFTLLTEAGCHHTTRLICVNPELPIEVVRQ